MMQMRMPTIREYLSNVIQLDDSPFIGDAKTPAPIVADDFQQMLTDFLDTEYTFYRLRKICFGMDWEDMLARVQKICDNVYLTHAYTYQHLYDTTVAVYDPIENYNMIEHEKTQNDGTDTTTHQLGSHTDTTVYGEQTLTDIIGNRQRTTDGTNDRAPFESQSYQHLDKNHETVSDLSATDRHTQSSRDDSTTYGGRTDTDKLEHGHDITRDLTRHGNIGVTTSQQMLESERELARFNLVRVVANDLVHALCVCSEGVCL